jgi:hypothetical protein
MADKLFANRLIGFDPVAERQRARETELRLMSQFAGNPYSSIGYSLGSLLGSGAKKLFNIEDEGTKRASDVQSALSQASSMFTPGSPEYFKDLAQRLEKYPDARAIALEEASKAEGAVEKTFRETQKFVGDFPEALAGEAQKVQTSVLNRLRRAGVSVETDPNTGELLTPIPPEVLAQVGQLPEVQRLNQLTQVATRSSIKQAGGITPSDTFAEVGLTLGIQPKSDLTQYSEAEAKQIRDKIQREKEGVAGAGVAQSAQDKVLLPGVAKTRETILTSALNSQNTRNTADRINNILDAAFTGVGQGAKLTAGQLAAAFGADIKGTTETEQLNSLLAQLAQGQAKSLPGALSEKELAFLREAIGKGSLTVNSLRAVVGRIKEDAIASEFENEGVQNVINAGGDLNRFDFVKNRREAQKRATLEVQKEQKEIQRLRELQSRRGRQ